MEPLTLYSFHRCPFAMRVRMVLHEKALPFSLKEEDLKNFSPELLKLHPEAKVPVLVHGARVLYESAIITEYLDEAFPQAPLMPQEAGARAEVRIWTYWCNQVFKPAVDRLKYGASRFSVAECEGVEAKIQSMLQKLETALQNSEYLVGASFTLADVHVFPFCRQLLRVEPQRLDLDAYPHLQEWAQRISSRPSFERTMAR